MSSARRATLQFPKSRDRPPSFDVLHGLRNPRWMLSFLNNCRRSNGERIAGALGRTAVAPVGWAEAEVYATLMADGLRIAGTAEINASDAPFNTKRITYLTRKSHEMHGRLGALKAHGSGFGRRCRTAFG